MTNAQKARDHAALAVAQQTMNSRSAALHATLASAFASLAVAEELAKFEAVAVEARHA